MIDSAYATSQFHPPEIDHAYGAHVHLLDDPVAWSILARACSPQCGQPELGRLVSLLYAGLARVVFAAELPRAQIEAPTRMASAHREAVYRGLAIDRRAPVVTVAMLALRSLA